MSQLITFYIPKRHKKSFLRTAGTVDRPTNRREKLRANLGLPYIFSNIILIIAVDTNEDTITNNTKGNNNG